MKTVHNISQIEWHLENNVQPILNNETITGIINTLTQLNDGKIKVTDEVFPGAMVTVTEMCNDLRIELAESH